MISVCKKLPFLFVLIAQAVELQLAKTSPDLISQILQYI